MRLPLSCLVIATALAACHHDNPTEPTERKPVDGGILAARKPVFCANSRIYPLTENTWELAFTSVNGHTLAGVGNDGGTFDYSLDITPQIASDLQQGAVQGCSAKVTFTAAGDVGTVGNGQASFTASTRVKVRAFTRGKADIDQTFTDGFNAPPHPDGCTLVVCTVSFPRVIAIPMSIQTVFQPGGKITVHSDATAHVAANGTSVWDQALADFAIPHGSGRSPTGPLLVITFP